MVLNPGCREAALAAAKSGRTQWLVVFSLLLFGWNLQNGATRSDPHKMRRKFLFSPKETPVSLSTLGNAYESKGTSPTGTDLKKGARGLLQIRARIGTGRKSLVLTENAKLSPGVLSSRSCILYDRFGVYSC